MRINTKRILSVLLAFCLLLSCIGSLFVVNAVTDVSDKQYKGFMYQDFETDDGSYVLKRTNIVEDPDNTSGQGKVLYYDETTADGVGVVQMNFADSLLSAGLDPEKPVYVAFKYKSNHQTGSSNWMQLRAATTATSTVDWGTHQLGSGYIYARNQKWYSTTIAGTLMDNGAYFTADHKSLSIGISRDSSYEKMYIDDIVVYQVTSVEVTGDSDLLIMEADPFEYRTADDASPFKNLTNYDFSIARIGDYYSFKLKKDAIVTYGNETVLPNSNGLYTIKITDGSVLNINAGIAYPLVKKEGAGSAKVDKDFISVGEQVTFSATPANENGFVGWYDADGNLVSANANYSFTFDGTQAVTLTAKFAPGAMQDFEKNFDDPDRYTASSNKVTRDPDDRLEKDRDMWGTKVLTENGNTYINMYGFYNVDTGSEAAKTIYYLTNLDETGLLATDGTKYKLTFKYRVRKGNSETFTEDTKTDKNPDGLTNGNITVRIIPEDYLVMLNQTDNMVELTYDAKADADGTWQTATIFDLPRYVVDGAIADGGYLKARITSVSGYTVDFDDFCFTPIAVSGTNDDIKEDWNIYDYIDPKEVPEGEELGQYIGDNARIAGSPCSSWASINYNTDKAYLKDDTDEYSLKFRALTQYPSTVFDVEPNKDYVISFYYYAPNQVEINGVTKTNLVNPDRTISSVGVLKPNGRYYYNSDDLLSYISYDRAFTGPFSHKVSNYLTTANSAVDSWQKIEIPFNSGELSQVALTVQFGASIVYVENLKLEQRSMDIPGPGAPGNKKAVDFDTNGEVQLQASDRMEITTAKGYDGKESKMLHIFEGIYDSPTLLNSKTTLKSDKDLNFTFSVDDEKVYKLSWRFKIAEYPEFDTKKYSKWYAFYCNYNGTSTSMATVHSLKSDKWYEFVYYIQPKEKQDVISFYFNAGSVTPESWIDDIVLEETDYEIFNGWDGNAEQIVIDFDKFAVNSEYSERIRIEDAPDKDGNTNNKAMKILGDDHSSAVCLNPGTTRKSNDPVFTMPVAPNTMYSLSYWLYVEPERKYPLGWFKFYYFYLSDPSEYKNDTEYYSKQGLLDATNMSTNGEWVKFETTFVTNSDQTSVTVTLNGSSRMPEMYLDDITLKEVTPGGVRLTNNSSYSESAYNLLSKGDYAKQITASKTAKIKIPLEPLTRYTFGITVNSSKISNSKIYLSFDGETMMSDSNFAQNAPDMCALSNGKTTRYGFEFVSSSNNYIYIVIENDDGALTLEDPYLFKSLSASTVRAMGHSEKPDTSLSVNSNEGLKKLSALNGDAFGGSAESSPSTGSSSILPFVLAFIISLITCITLVKFRFEKRRSKKQ